MFPVSLQELSEDRFAMAELFGKLANFHADVSSHVIESSSNF